MSEAAMRSGDETTPSNNVEQLHGGVGALLASSRERLGEELPEVAKILRINWRYIKAIEESRFERLPGRAYAIGFVRAYAEHLGLDADEVVRRFKLESQGVQKGPELIFPEAIPEGRGPGGGVLVVSALIAVVAYGGWYFMAEHDGTNLQAAAPPPKSFTESAEASAASAAPEPAAPVLAPAPAPVPVQAVEAAVPAPVPAPVQAPIQAELTQTAAVVTPEQAPAPAPEFTQSAAVVTPEPAPVIEPAPAPASEFTQSAAAVVAPEQAPAPEPEFASAPVQTAAVPNIGPSTGIVLRAKATSWVQVRDQASGQTIITQVMRNGDEIKVPNMPGLVLLTGNAGALDVVVDGVTAPAIGGSGQILRNVILQRDRLLAGTAAP